MQQVCFQDLEFKLHTLVASAPSHALIHLTGEIDLFEIVSNILSYSKKFDKSAPFTG